MMWEVVVVGQPFVSDHVQFSVSRSRVLKYDEVVDSSCGNCFTSARFKASSSSGGQELGEKQLPEVVDLPVVHTVDLKGMVAPHAQRGMNSHLPLARTARGTSLLIVLLSSGGGDTLVVSGSSGGGPKS